MRDRNTVLYRPVRTPAARPCCGVVRNLCRWHPKLHHVLVEMEKGHLKDIDLPKSLRRTYSLHEVVQVRKSSVLF